MFSIDATHNERLGRYINDSCLRDSQCNVKPMVFKLDCSGKPHILFFAKRDIEIGEELRFDYDGCEMPWREVSTQNTLLTVYVNRSLA